MGKDCTNFQALLRCFCIDGSHDALTFALTPEIQHSRLVKMRDDRGTLPLEYASRWVQHK